MHIQAPDTCKSDGRHITMFPAKGIIPFPTKTLFLIPY